MNYATLGVETGHHVLDGAILSRCVDPLQDDQQGPLILGVEPLLQIGEARSVLGDNSVSGFFGEAGGLGRIESAEAEGLGLFDPEALRKLNVVHACVLGAGPNSAA